MPRCSSTAGRTHSFENALLVVLDPGEEALEESLVSLTLEHTSYPRHAAVPDHPVELGFLAVKSVLHGVELAAEVGLACNVKRLDVGRGLVDGGWIGREGS